MGKTALRSTGILYWLGPFHGAIAVPSVTRCHCHHSRRGHRCTNGVRRVTVATPGEWACGSSQWQMDPTFFKCFLLVLVRFSRVRVSVTGYRYLRMMTRVQRVHNFYSDNFTVQGRSLVQMCTVPRAIPDWPVAEVASSHEAVPQPGANQRAAMVC